MLTLFSRALSPAAMLMRRKMRRVAGLINEATTWPFSTTAPRLPGPWASVNDGSLGTLVNSAGNVVYGPSNIAIGSASQTVTVTSGVQYTLSFYGTGSVAYSGAASGTLAGAGVSNRVSVTVSATTSSLVLTVTGSITILRVQPGATSNAADDQYLVTTSAAFYLPRLTYDPATLAPLGMLVEGAATNAQPEDPTGAAYLVFNGASWSAADLNGWRTITCPSGSVSWYGGTGAGAAAQRYCYSVEYDVSAGSGDPRITITDDATGEVRAEFSRSTLAATITASGDWTSTLAGAIHMGGSVYRLWVSGLKGASGNARHTFSIPATGAAKMRRWQLEVGSYPSSFIPNPTTGSMTRARDAISITGAALTAAFPAEILGPELVINGDFGSATNWSLAPGSGGSASISGGALTLSGGSASFPNATQTGILSSGRFYKVEVTLTTPPSTSGVLGIRVGGVSSNGPTNLTTAGVHTFIVQSDGTDFRFIRNSGSADTVVIDSVSIKEVIQDRFAKNTIVVMFRKRYSLAAPEIIFSLSGSTFGLGRGMLFRTSGADIQAGGNSTSVTATGAFTAGSAVQTVALSWDTATTALLMSVNGGAVQTLSTFDFTGVGTTHFNWGSLVPDSASQQIAAVEIVSFDNSRAGQYITGSALQALSAL